jgi:MFS family permease
MSDFQIGMLFAVFSLCQFVASPIIGRMSDKYGRRPLLLISLAGTALSLLMTAFAPSAFFLYLARALDGITAGNYPVIAGVIGDSTKEEERAQAFGIMGASWSAGFVFGPAIAAVSSLSNNIQLPFIVAAVVAAISFVITFIMLPETNKHIGEVHEGKLFDIRKLVTVLFDDKVGRAFLISLIFFLSFGMFVYVFQPFAVKVLHLSPFLISLSFTITGVFELLAQVFLIGMVTKRFGENKALTYALALTTATLFAYFFSRDFTSFIIISIINGIAASFVMPLLSTILSRETDAKSQGSIQGISASYQSIGFIGGPVIAGAVATIAVPYPYLASAIFCLACVFLSRSVFKPGAKKESAF